MTEEDFKAVENYYDSLSWEIYLKKS
jgi:hypothetical protein